MPVQRYNQCRISNPRSDVHSARLRSGQGLEITLDAIKQFGFPADYVWEVRTESPFLKVQHSEVNGTRRTVRIDQVGDLHRWAQISRTFLGNVNIFARPRLNEDEVLDPATFELSGRVCVYLETINSAKENCLTVIAPDNHTCKLDVNDLIEVVIPEDLSGPLNWNAYPYRADSSGDYAMEEIRTEYLAPDEQNNRRSIDNEFFCEHRTYMGADSVTLWPGDHHFWFRFDEKTRSLAGSGPPACEFAARLVFLGKNDKGECVRHHQLRVYIDIKKKDKANKESEPTKSTIITDVKERYLNTVTRCISNPHAAENLVMKNDHECFFVELIKPATNKWDFVYWDASSTSGRPVKCLQVEEVSPIIVDGMTLQKFRVRPTNLDRLYSQKTGPLKPGESHYLGVLEFQCNTPSGLDRRRLTFNLQRSNAAISVTGSASKPYNASTAVYGPCSSTSASTSSKKKGKHDAPEYCDVEITDIFTTSLAQGERIESYAAVSEKALPALTDQRDVKKKDKSSDISPASTSTASKSTENSGSTRNPSNPSGRSDRLQSVSAPTSDGDLRPEAEPYTVVNDPQNLTSIVVRLNKSVLVRMPTSGKSPIDKWDYHVCQNNPGYNIQVSTGWLNTEAIPFEEFRVTVRKVGNYSASEIVQTELRTRAGVIRFTGGDDGDVRLVYVDIRDALPPAERPSSATVVSVVAPAAVKVSRDLLQNRITVVDPLCLTPTDVDVSPGEELEIILHPPQGRMTGDWKIVTTMFSGHSTVVDNSLWTLWNNEVVQRVLVRFVGASISGQIAIKWGKEERDTGRIAIIPRRRNRFVQPSEPNGGVVSRLGQGVARAVYLQTWANNERLAVTPYERLFVRIENPEKHFAAGIRPKMGEVELTQWPLNKSVLSALKPEIQQSFSGNRPWYSSDGVFMPGDNPWDSCYYCLKPLDDTNFHVGELLAAMAKIWGNRCSYPIGTLEFKMPVGKEFTLVKTLRLEVGNPEFVKGILQDWAPIVLRNPQDGGQCSMSHGGSLQINLTPKTDNHCQSQSMHFWRLDSHPAWLTYLGEDEVACGHPQPFKFYVDRGGVDDAVQDGKLKFVCGTGAATRRICLTLRSFNE